MMMMMMMMMVNKMLIASCEPSVANLVGTLNQTPAKPEQCSVNLLPKIGRRLDREHATTWFGGGSSLTWQVRRPTMGPGARTRDQGSGAGDQYRQRLTGMERVTCGTLGRWS